MQLLPLLLQLMLKSELVLPLPGLIEAEQVGRAGACVTETWLESQEALPPGPVARSVTKWLPAPKRPSAAVKPLQSTDP